VKRFRVAHLLTGAADSSDPARCLDASVHLICSFQSGLANVALICTSHSWTSDRRTQTYDRRIMTRTEILTKET
jgi:hypothetical protein